MGKYAIREGGEVWYEGGWGKYAIREGGEVCYKGGWGRSGQVPGADDYFHLGARAPIPPLHTKLWHCTVHYTLHCGTAQCTTHYTMALHSSLHYTMALHRVHYTLHCGIRN